MKLTLLLGTCVLVAIAATATILGLNARRQASAANDRWWRSAQRLTADDIKADEGFGLSVALDGDRAIVGAPLASVTGACSGAAYIFPNGGNQSSIDSSAKLKEEDATASGVFGSSVALCGQMALVGKPGDNHAGTKAGAAVLYQRDAEGYWIRIAKLVADDAMADDEFGICVALDERVAFVAAKTGNLTGAVYIFECDRHGDWRQCAKLVPEQQTSQACFGFSIAIHGDCAAVGSHGDQSAGDGHRGAVYLFKRTESADWKQTAKLAAPDKTHCVNFGRSVAVFDRAIVVGALGAAFLFQDDGVGTWKAIAQLVPHDAVSSRSFGNAVAISGRTIAVGAPSENEASGAVYLFQVDDQHLAQQVGKLTLPGQPPNSWFGVELAMSRDNLLVGAQYAGGQSPKSGAAYLFHLATLNPISHVQARSTDR